MLFGLGRKKWANSDAIDAGGAHAVTIGGIPSLERFQVDPYGKSRLHRFAWLSFRIVMSLFTERNLS